ncbi:MAG: hypothetical protein RLZZ59_16 [Pseudomonadota bacterium]
MLITADKFDDTGKAKCTLSIELEDVTFNSIGGSWTIHGKVMVDSNPAINIKTNTHFGTAFDAGSACHNAAGAFEEAVTDFIKEVLHRVK